MIGSLRHMVFALGVVFAVSGMALAQAPATVAADLPDLPADGPWFANHELPVHSDGNLPGQLRVFDSQGNLVPARVQLYFLQSGRVVNRTMPNEAGEFQLVGAQPGVYSVVAVGPQGFGAFSVRVRPPVEAATPPKANTIGTVRPAVFRAQGALTMNVSLIQPIDTPVAYQLMQQNVPGLPQGPPAGAVPPGPLSGPLGAGGGGGGGGGGLGALLGAGGLAAGLAGLGNDDNNNQTPASAANTGS